MKNIKSSGQKIICLNRKASFNYYFKEFLEAGIVLKGSEVKSLRDGKASIADSYALDKNGEIYLINSHIPLYRQSSYNNHDPKEDRKLLLKKKDFLDFEKKSKKSSFDFRFPDFHFLRLIQSAFFHVLFLLLYKNNRHAYA